jgi:hypothetical protein
MRKYILGFLVLIVAIGGFLYDDLASPRAQARDTAIAFWQACTRPISSWRCMPCLK